MGNILEDVQIMVADKLNGDPRLSACEFVWENARTVDYQIRQALGKQGVVGLVLTPSAVYQGRLGDVCHAWQLDKLEIDVVENPTVNRGKDDYVTGQDAAMAVFDVLCPLTGEGEGDMCPATYEEQEVRGLLVNKCVLKCLATRVDPQATVITTVNGKKKVGRIGELTPETLSSFGIDPGEVKSFEGGSLLSSIGDLTFLSCGSIESFSFQGESIGTAAFRSCSSLTAAHFGPALTSVGDRAFCFDAAMTSAFFDGQPPVTGERGFYGCYDLSAFVLSGSEAWDQWSTANDIPVVPR